MNPRYRKGWVAALARIRRMCLTCMLIEGLVFIVAFVIFAVR
jgi:hypothetical protein